MNTNPKIYSDRICYYESIINDPQDLIDRIENSNASLTEADPITKWQDWVASGDDTDVYVFGKIKHTDASKLPNGSYSSSLIYNSLRSALELAGRDYADRFNIEYQEPQPISISRYDTGTSMGPHVDDYGKEGIMPIMSAVMYLNDDYEGGELHFPVQDILIKPVSGSIVIFPSVEPFYHESLSIKSGSKYMVPAFWVKTTN
jgi:hypothetical protein